MSTPREPPKIRTGTTIDRDDLAATALALFKAEGMSQRELADAIGKSQPSVSAALADKNNGTRYEQMRVLIIEHLSGYSLRPLYRAEKR